MEEDNGGATAPKQDQELQVRYREGNECKFVLLWFLREFTGPLVDFLNITYSALRARVALFVLLRNKLLFNGDNVVKQ